MTPVGQSLVRQSDTLYALRFDQSIDHLAPGNVRATPPLCDVEGWRSMESNIAVTPKLAYSIREACRASSLGRSTIYTHISAGRLRAVRVGGRTLIPAESLEALIAGEA